MTTANPADENLLIPYAMKDGVVVHVSRVEGGLACGATCLCCGQPLVAHKGQQVRHHFAHLAGATACETPLHSAAKWLIYQRVKDSIADGGTIPTRWRCHLCVCHHEIDLIGGADLVSPPETRMPRTRVVPDVWLSADGGKSPCALVEIVVTHAPEDYTKRYADRRKIPLWEFHLFHTIELDNLLTTPLFASAGRVPDCPCHLCPDCGRRECAPNMHDHVWCEKCGQCHRDITQLGQVHRHCDGCDGLLNPFAAAHGYAFCLDCQQDDRHLLDPAVFPATGSET